MRRAGVYEVANYLVELIIIYLMDRNIICRLTSFFYGHYAHDSRCVQVDRLEDELYREQEKFKAITEELEQTFAEMSGY